MSRRSIDYAEIELFVAKRSVDSIELDIKMLKHKRNNAAYDMVNNVHRHNNNNRQLISQCDEIIDILSKKQSIKTKIFKIKEDNLRKLRDPSYVSINANIIDSDYSIEQDDSFESDSD
jgi:flagellar biosynthesis chaperone FliJ